MKNNRTLSNMLKLLMDFFIIYEYENNIKPQCAHLTFDNKVVLFIAILLRNYEKYISNR